MISKVYGKLYKTLPRSSGYWAHAYSHRSNYSTSQVSDAPIKPVKIINAQPNLNLAITQRAASRLGEIFRSSNEVLRIGVESGGCHGFQYNLKLISKDDAGHTPENHVTTRSEEDEFEDDDEFNDNKDIIFVLPDKGGEVIVDEKSLKILNNTTLTYTTELIGSTFKITGGNMKSSCGCGSSFDVEV